MKSLEKDKDFDEKVSEIFSIFSNIKNWNYLDIDIIMRSFNHLFNHEDLLAMTTYDDTMKKGGRRSLLDLYNDNCKKSGTRAHSISEDGNKLIPEEIKSFENIN